MDATENRRVRNVAVVGTLTIGLVAAAVVVAVSASGGELDREARDEYQSRVSGVDLERPQPRALEVVAGKNASGESFGPAPDLADGRAPDLIEAWATNGALGYVRASDLLPELEYANSLEEALAQERSAQPKVIPVYLSDGVTQIGDFEFGTGEVIEVAVEDIP